MRKIFKSKSIAEYRYDKKQISGIKKVLIKREETVNKAENQLTFRL